MRQGKKPTVAQRKLISSFHLNWENWLVVEDTPTHMTIRHRITDQAKRLPKWRYQDA